MSDWMRNSSTCLIVLMLTPALSADESKQRSVEGATPLSVAPLDHIEYPQDRPNWVSRSVSFDKESAFIIVVSGPCESREESIEELWVMIRAAVSTYISQQTDSGQHDFYPISDEEIDDHLVVRRYAGEVLQGDMKKYENAVELRFTAERREQIKAAWKNVEVRDRLGAIGVLVSAGLAMLICSSVVVGMVSRRVERRDNMQAAA